jgi:sugar/nucleoside kinase (ribokinase family)
VIVCLGEALVDLICERPVTSFAKADSFAPHFGGALANVAAGRAGADAALAGGAGDDEWVAGFGRAAFMGTFVAGLAQRGWDPAPADEALGPALEAAAEACTRWSALD